MIKKTLVLAALAAVGAAIALGWPDIQRFMKIKQISGHQSHPEMVPAEGRTTYPQHHAAGAPDGTGDFDSASRGGPAVRV
jgi:hypothetical protein